MSPSYSSSDSGDQAPPPSASPDEKEALGKATDSVRAALKERQQRISKATKQQDAAQKRHAAEVGKLTKALQEARNPRKLAGGWGVPGGAQLFYDHVVVMGVSHPLGPDVSAIVDSAGNISRTRRVTLTRFALLGAFSLLAPKGTKHDDRELFLLLEGPDWAELIKCDPMQQATVRAFAQKFNLAARTVDANRTAHQQHVSAAEAGLARAQANTSELDGCGRALAAELNDKSALEQSLGGLDALLAHYPEPESRSARKAREAADAADLALNPSKARSRLAQAAQRAALRPGSSTETPPYWPPPPGWKPSSKDADELSPASEQPALPPASGTTPPPYWPPPPGWTPTAVASGDQQSAEYASYQLADSEAGAEQPREEPVSESQRSDAAAPGGDEASLDVIEQITRLGGLRDKGLISDDEFESKKRELLERL